MEQNILCLNGGSSSLKFAVYEVSDAGEERIFSCSQTRAAHFLITPKL
jgi:acetate kinase